jgi:hypothetical protein
MHLDGSRIWHVAAETLTPVKELCDSFDSVNVCFSKGLGKNVPFLFYAHVRHFSMYRRPNRVMPCWIFDIHP